MVFWWQIPRQSNALNLATLEDRKKHRTSLSSSSVYGSILSESGVEEKELEEIEAFIYR